MSAYNEVHEEKEKVEDKVENSEFKREIADL